MGRAKKQPKKLTVLEDHEESKKWWYLWAALVAVVSVLIMVTWSITLFSRTYSEEYQNFKRSSSSSNGSSKVYGTPGKVDVKVLSSPDASFARSCAQRGVPVVLRNSVVQKWPAKKWSPSYLQSKLSSLSGIYENDNHWFGPYFDTTKPLLDHAVRKNPYQTDLKLSVDEFFQRLVKPQHSRYLYFTGGIEQLGDWAYREIQPISELLLLNPRRSSVNAWIGQPNVIAHCHYDGYHNFYAQLYGRKKFTLFRPTNWPGLYPYPFLHPSHAQTQVNSSDQEDVKRFELFKMVEAVEVSLEAGDLLYMPPLWFHEVESLSLSISVNVWTDSQQTELAERIFSLPLPLHSNYESSHGHEHIRWRDMHEQRIGTAILIFKLLEQICKYHSCANDQFTEPLNPTLSVPPNPQGHFIHQLWSTRYKHLMDRGELPTSFRDSGGESDSILCEDGDGKDVQAASAVISRDVHYGAYLEQVSQLVRGLPDDTWQLWVGNYVEFVVASVLQDAKHVGLFLKHVNSCIILLS